MMHVHRLLRAGLLTLGVLAGGLAFYTPAALADEAFAVTAAFGTAGSGNDEFNQPDGVAVNQETGDVYVVDKGNNRVERFSSTGEYETQFNGTEIDGVPAGAGKEAPAKFYVPEGIAIDNACFYQKLSEPQCKTEHPSNGDVYVVDAGHGVIDKFSATGSFISQIDVSGLGSVSIAEDSSGNLWVYVEYNAQVSRFSEAGAEEAVFSSGESNGDAIAVGSNGSEDIFYLRNGYAEFIGAFNRSGERLYWIGEGSAPAVDLATNGLFFVNHTSLEEYGLHGFSARSPTIAAAGGVAVNSTSHEVYVTDISKNLVDIVNLGAAPTEPKTEAGEVKGQVFTLKGELLGGESDYYFAYNDNGGCGGGGQTREGEATGTAQESVTIGAGLESNTQYAFCIVAANLYGANAGPPATFTTGVLPPVVEGASATYVGVFEATLQAQVHPENQTVACRVQYGETTAYGEEAPCEPASLSGRGGQNATLDLKGLHGGTIYHYRVVAENAAGETNGPSEGTGNFKTPPALEPAIEAESASVESGKEEEPRATTLQARVNPKLQQTTSCVFEYGKLGKPYQASVPCEQSAGQIGKGAVGVPVSLTVAGLAAGADYHYRVVVANETGTSDGADKAFGPPTAVTGAVLSGTPGMAPSTTAPIGGEVNPESLDTRYYVQYGTESEEYSQSAPFLPLGIPLPRGIDAGSGEAAVALGRAGGPPDIPLEGLTPGATYRYRLVAYNADGTTYGAPMTLTVPPAPLVGPASVSEVTQSSVTITTSVDPEGLHTVYKLDVGTSTAYGTPYPGDAGSGSAPIPLTFHLSGLHVGDTYHFRLAASNSDGSSSESDQTFTTVATTLGVPSVFAVPLSPPLLSFTAPVFPKETGTTTTKVLTNAQKLAGALKACKRKPKNKRVACMRQARKRYGPVKKAKRASKGAHRSG